MNSSPYQKREEDKLLLAIKEDQVSVAPEGQVEIHIAVINERLEEDYVEIEVKGVPADWTTIDTPVVHLAAGEAKQVILDVQAPPLPQSRVGQYPLDVRAVSQTNPLRSVAVRSIVTVAAYQSKGRMGVLLDSVQFSISPGSQIEIPIVLENRGLEGDSFALKVEGLPVDWISTNSLVTGLDPSTSREIILTINVPRTPEASAGRTPFTSQFISEEFPDQKTEVECILTILAFSRFSASLEPARLPAGQYGQVIINNEGNTSDAYSLTFQDPFHALVFEKAVQVPRAEAQPDPQRIEIAYMEIPAGERIQVASGQRDVYPFRCRLRSRPLISTERPYPFTVTALSSDYKAVELLGQVNEKGIIPIWMVPLAVIVLLLCLLLLLISARGVEAAAVGGVQAQIVSLVSTVPSALVPTISSNENRTAFSTDTETSHPLHLWTYPFACPVGQDAILPFLELTAS